jgi:hypothetical protein
VAGSLRLGLRLRVPCVTAAAAAACELPSRLVARPTVAHTGGWLLFFRTVAGPHAGTLAVPLTPSESNHDGTGRGRQCSGPPHHDASSESTQLEPSGVERPPTWHQAPGAPVCVCGDGLPAGPRCLQRTLSRDVTVPAGARVLVNEAWAQTVTPVPYRRLADSLSESARRVHRDWQAAAHRTF